ncbi:hypothetical protein [Cupriavidus sp. D384]|uniref:hypothetical protein n=1 Tax=Cupriavidus sp. D384 TaxID=1538095 RepID=UPI00082EC14E|nr:hypothetical protein [Cupriavidus sp. D384]
MNLSPEQLAGIINEGINTALAGVLERVKSLEAERARCADIDPLLTRIKELESEVGRLQAKAMNGAAFVRRRVDYHTGESA